VCTSVTILFPSSYSCVLNSLNFMHLN
jgi:hypothetical protein